MAERPANEALNSPPRSKPGRLLHARIGNYIKALRELWMLGRLLNRYFYG
jgi:hypothetical protein